MKILTSFKPKSALYISLCFFMLIGCKKDQKNDVEKVKYDAEYKAVDACVCQPDWFPHNQTPPPAEGKGSPFDVSSTTNCIFHQWSWQKFLWLTKPQANNNPLFLNELTQVSDALIPVPKRVGANIVLTDTEQAGLNAVLKANPSYGGTDQIARDFTVYYSIHSNAIMMKAAQNFKDSLKSGKLSPTNLRSFPVGSLELKVSWVDANTITVAKQKDFYITTAAVSTDGKTFTNKRVALLGMHVVGVVINHPEFIWATFQHNDLAPIYDWKTNQATSADEKLLYSKGATSGLNGITWVKGSGATLPLKPYDLFKFGVPKVPGDQYMTTCQSEPMNFDNIQTINNCVSTKLNDVWNNYFYNGSIWLNTDGLTPVQQAQLIVSQGYGIDKATPGSSARGSLNNANITMETYTQTFQTNISDINVNTLTNCFSCHSGVSFTNNSNRSPLYISHVFEGYVRSSEGKTREEINRLKDRQFLLHFVKKTLK
ncbi:hypothetical protein [Flavobacterium sp.]|uniref:hypothetical protein n=1 Tax=Flavobacterium sp. TaxID=239 RepID=UPI00260C1CE6|nr:hypothetical protein [Flavobacterium sp.]